MKKLSAILFAASALSVFAATSPIYINISPVTVFDRPPQIDARAFVNRSTFEVSTALPFQGQNVQFWTNNAMMNGAPGFRFEQDRTGRIVIRNGRYVIVSSPSRRLQLPSAVFYNDGNITGSTMLLVNATNIYHSGRMDGLETGKISLVAANGTADLSRGGIRVGTATGLASACGSFSVGSNFVADTAILDQYWGAGRDNDLGTNGTALDLVQLASGFGSSFNQPSLSLPFPRAASHQVLQPFSGSRTFTNIVSLPSFGCSDGYTVHMHTNFNNQTSMVVNVVFVPTNSLLSPDNLSVDVRFAFNSGRAGNAYAPVIEFRTVDFDIVDQQLATNYITFIDASAAQTNITLARPSQVTGTRAPSIRRPSTYTWIRGRYCSFDFSDPANAFYDPSIFYNPSFRTNRANTIYAADRVSIGSAISQTVNTLPLGTNPRLTDQTNFSGTVSIVAKQLNLENSRIRAQDFIGIQTPNLISNSFAQLDAPFIDFDVRSTNSLLLISNLAPASVSRIFGTIAAWSSVWSVDVTNTVSGELNNIRFHVTLVDNCLQASQPVTMHRFGAAAPNLVIADKLSINAGLKIEAGSLTVQRTGGLNLPAGANLAFTNVKQLLNFTNDGTLNVPAAAFFGIFQSGQTISKKIPALKNFVNRGSIAASSIFVRSTNVQVEGAEFLPAILSAGGGLVAITASNAAITQATINSSSDVEIHANAVRLENTAITAGLAPVRGALVIDATNSFGDLPGVVTTNHWVVNSGVRLLRRPTQAGDLLGTHIRSTAGQFVASTIAWAGNNLGAVPEGFTNNLSVGRLTLDGAGGNLFRFRSAKTGNAIYVDYLELLNNATNYNFALGVDADFIIYFGDSNISPVKLTNNAAGRLRWVSQFTGPQSSVSLVYPNGVTYTFNAGLVRSFDIDSDGDGIVNAEDCTPIPVPGFDTTLPCPPSPDLARSAAFSTQNIGLNIALGAAGGEVVLNWNAAAGSANTVEFTDSPATGSWQALTNFINGPVDTRVTVKDAAGAPLRVYRVRVGAGKP